MAVSRNGRAIKHRTCDYGYKCCDSMHGTKKLRKLIRIREKREWKKDVEES